jgi:hypothetical protein
MKPHAFPLATLITSCVAFCSANGAFGEEAKGADIKARVQQLEKRVAELEKAVKDLRASAKGAPRTEIEKLLVGTWVVAEADRGQARYTDLRLNGDGTCSVVWGGVIYSASKYQTTGKVVSFFLKKGDPKELTLRGSIRIVSISEKELDMQHVSSDGSFKVVKVRYTRAK